MTIEQYNKKLDNVVRELNNNGKMMVKLGTSALTFIRQRVIEKGVDAKGALYKPYSTKKMLTNCSTMTLSACNKIAGSKEKRKELEWVTINGHKLFNIPGGYKQYREMHGRQTGHVDFSFTNNMWNDINIISNDSRHNNGEVIIGARKQSEKDKLAGNTKRRGNILDLNPKEINDLYTAYNLNTLQIFRNNGL